MPTINQLNEMWEAENKIFGGDLDNEFSVQGSLTRKEELERSRSLSDASKSFYCELFEERKLRTMCSEQCDTCKKLDS